MIDTQSIRTKILDLAMRGQLTEQLPEDGTAEELYQQIQEEKQALIKAGKIKKEKPLPEIAEGEKPFEIPASWKWVRLGNITEIAGGTTPSSDDVISSGSIPYFKVSDMNAPGNEKYMYHAVSFVKESYSGKIFPAGSIIYPKNGGAALTNKRRILVNDSAVDLNTGCCIPFFQNMSEWLKLFFETIDFGKMNTGSNIPTVNSSSLKKYLVPLAPLLEQQRIVDRVQQAFSALDTIDELQTQYADNLTVLKSKLIDAAIQGKLTAQLPEDGTAEELYQQIQEEKQALIRAGKIKKEKPLPEITEGEMPFEIPKSWKWVTLTCITKKITDGTHHSPVNTASGDFMYVTAKNIKESGVILENISYVTTSVHNEIFARCDPEKDDVLLIKDGATTGVVTVNNINEPFSMLSSVALIKPMPQVDPWYIVYAMRSSWFYKYIRNEMTGVGITRVVLRQIETFSIPLPPLAEQKRIVARLGELLPLCEKLK